jgi:ankyrin repeat protein
MQFTKLDRSLFDEIFEEEPKMQRIEQLIKKGANPNAIDPESLNTVLMEAVEILDDEEAPILRQLVAMGANPNLESDELNPLVLAVYDQRYLFVKILLELGAKPDYTFADGQTVLQAAEEFLEEIREEELDDAALVQVISLLR